MSTPLRCFVSLPAGTQSTKFSSDDVFELLIAPALERFGFETVRADRLSRPDVLSSDIIDQIQTADLCIFDLSDQSPNVFYECGRRHETGRPYLHIIRKGEQIPFDIAGIRTIVYDLSDARVTRQAVIDVQNAVSSQQKLGFTGSTANANLASINDRLARIEDVLVNLPQGALRKSSTADAFTDPRRAFQQAFIDGDIERVITLLPRIEAISGHGETLIAASTAVARAGFAEGADMLWKVLKVNFGALSVDDAKHCVAGLVQYFSTRDLEAEGIDRLEPVIDRILLEKEVTAQDRAFLINQLQILAYGAGNYEAALEGANKVVALDPDEAAYRYNRSLIFEKLGRLDDALADIAAYMQHDPDADHLAHAAQVLAEAGRPDEALEIIQQLKGSDSDRAQYLLNTLEKGLTK